MANFSANNLGNATPAQTNMSTAYKTAVNISSSSGTAVKRLKIYDLLVGTDGTPADNYVEWIVNRSTAIGTGVSGTINPLDPADAASLAVSTINHPTIEPTITANTSAVWFVGVNQRASYRWVAAPGSEIVIAATNAVGCALRAQSSGYASTFTGQIYFQEQ